MTIAAIEDEQPDRRWECPACPLSFLHARDLMSHMERMHTGWVVVSESGTVTLYWVWGKGDEP